MCDSYVFVCVVRFNFSSSFHRWFLLFSFAMRTMQLTWLSCTALNITICLIFICFHYTFCVQLFSLTFSKVRRKTFDERIALNFHLSYRRSAWLNQQLDKTLLSYVTQAKSKRWRATRFFTSHDSNCSHVKCEEFVPFRFR